jgi:hypothetical protein
MPENACSIVVERAQIFRDATTRLVIRSVR